MTKIATMFKFLVNPEFRFYVLSLKSSLYNSMPDDEYLKKLYKIKMHRNLNLDNPKRYTEKIQWLKLNDRKPIYTTMVDKYEAKEYVRKVIGDEYIIKTLGVWKSFDDIDFEELPNQFVLKCTHDSGGLVICRDKKEFNLKNAKKKIERSMKRNYFWSGREWPYKNVCPRIIAEEYMEDAKTSELRDYKLFTFNGITKAFFIASDRQKEGEETKFDFFDGDYNHLAITNGHPNSDTTPDKPINLELMKDLAYKLAKGIPHLRVDFYEVNGKVYFGELTFSHWSGMVPFEPDEWDEKFGNWIDLEHLNS